MFTKIVSLFGRRATVATKTPHTRGRPSNRARPGVERLDGRESPSYLAFGTAYVAGAVSAANGLSASSYYLPRGSAYGNLAYRTTGSVSDAYSHLSYSNNNHDTVRLELQSSLNTGNYTSGN